MASCIVTHKICKLHFWRAKLSSLTMVFISSLYLIFFEYILQRVTLIRNVTKPPFIFETVLLWYFTVFPSHRSLKKWFLSRNTVKFSEIWRIRPSLVCKIPFFVWQENLCFNHCIYVYFLKRKVIQDNYYALNHCNSFI